MIPLAMIAVGFTMMMPWDELRGASLFEWVMAVAFYIGFVVAMGAAVWWGA